MGWKEYVPDIHHLWYPVTQIGKEQVMIFWPDMCHISYQHLDFLPLVQTVQSLAQGSPRASFSFSYQWPRPDSCLFFKQKYFCSCGQGVHFDNSHPLGVFESQWTDPSPLKHENTRKYCMSGCDHPCVQETRPDVFNTLNVHFLLKFLTFHKNSAVSTTNTRSHSTRPKLLNLAAMFRICEISLKPYWSN